MLPLTGPDQLTSNGVVPDKSRTIEPSLLLHDEAGVIPAIVTIGPSVLLTPMITLSAQPPASVTMSVYKPAIKSEAIFSLELNTFADQV